MDRRRERQNIGVNELGAAQQHKALDNPSRPGDIQKGYLIARPQIVQQANGLRDHVQIKHFDVQARCHRVLCKRHELFGIELQTRRRALLHMDRQIQ